MITSWGFFSSFLFPHILDLVFQHSFLPSATWKQDNTWGEHWMRDKWGSYETNTVAGS